MATTPTASFLQRLPQFITLLFSLTLVNGFRLLADTYSWSTQPAFDVRDPAQTMIAVTFGLTLFWVVTAWLGYGLLIERYPYTLNFSRFFFDVARFVIMFALINFSFLAGTPGTFHSFAFTLAIFHLMMTGWHLDQTRAATPERRRERQGDAKAHLLRSSTYLLLGFIYLVVAQLSTAGISDSLHYGVVLVTLAAMSVWTVMRLAELRGYAAKEMTEPAGPAVTTT